MHRNIRLLSIFNFLTDFSFLAPLSILYFAHISGSFTLGMSIFSIVMLSSSVFEIPTGIFSDHLGRKKTIVLGAFFGILFTLCYAIGLSYWWLVAGAILEGVARAFYSGNNDAYLHDILKDNHQEDEYHEFLGKVSSMFQVALAISAVLGGILATISFVIVAWLDVVPAVLKFLVSLSFKDTVKRVRDSGNIYSDLSEALNLFLRNPKLRILSLSSMLGYAISEPAYQFRSAFVATLWPLWAIGFSKVLSNIGAAISFYLSGRVIKRFGEYKLLVIDSLYSKVINFISLLFPSIFSPILMSSTSLLYGVTEVAESNLLQKEFAEHQRATMGSLNSLGGSFLFGIFALILGQIADTWSPVQGLLIFQVLSLIPLSLYLYLLRKDKRVRRNHDSPV